MVVHQLPIYYLYWEDNIVGNALGVYRHMAYLKSGGFLVVVDLVVECGRLEAALVFADVYVFR